MPPVFFRIYRKLILLFRNVCIGGFNACDNVWNAQNWLIEQSLVHIWGFLILLISGRYRTTFKANNEGTELVSRKILSTRSTKLLYVPIGNPIKQYKKMLTWGFLLACTNRGIPNPRIQHVLKFWLKKSLFSTVITVLNFTLVVRLSLHFHRRPPKIMRFGSLVTYYYSWQYQTSVFVSVTDIYNGYQN